MTASQKLFYVGFMVLVVSLCYALISVSGPRWGKENGLCDQAVNTLLTTRDRVDLERAMFLVRWYNCSISQRL